MKKTWTQEDGRRKLVRNGRGKYLGKSDHGRITVYNLGCRCLACTAENTRYRAEARRVRYHLTQEKRLPETVAHGKAATRINWGCKCEPCRLAHREKRKEYERKKEARSA